MLGAKAESAPLAPTNDRSTFFRQSGWLMIANIGGGVFMWAVHFLNKFMPDGEYGIFGALLSVIMLLPALPLQMVFAQQTARAIATNKIGELSALIRRAWGGTFAVWLAAMVIIFFSQDWILDRWQLANPVGLWVTMVAVLLSIWMPIFWGVLQGQQNFLWLGWSMISNGFLRLTTAAIAVILLYNLATARHFSAGTYAAGVMIGVVGGVAIAVGIAVWQTRGLWKTTVARFDWRNFSRQVTPLLLAFLSFQVLFTADTIFVKSYFTGHETDFYVGAGTLSRALMWLVGPLATVMFPRLVQSAAKGEKQDLMGLVLAGTALLAVVGALSLTLLGPLVVKIVYKGSFVQEVPLLLPWYGAAMVPLSLANVLLNNLMAKPSSKGALAGWILALAIGYVGALTQFHRSLVQVLQVVCVFNTLLLAVCAWFSWRARQEPVAAVMTA